MSSSTAAPTSSPRLETALAARLGPDRARASRALLWRDRLTSLWAPPCVLGLAFIPYLFLIGLSPPSARWAQPAMQYLALALLAAFVGLLLFRLLVPRAEALRKLRREGRELVGEVDGLLRRAGSKVSPVARERLTERALALESASLGADAGRLEQELKALDAATQEHLGAWRKRHALDFAGGFVKALAVALAIRTLLIEPYKIPSGSMLPTLEIGDQVFVNKFIYGVRIPFMNVVPFVIVRPPERGDVIVFNNPVDESTDFIKRVVGVPGDRVELVDEVVHINGRPVEREKVDGDFLVFNKVGEEWTADRLVRYEENLSGQVHDVLQERHHPKQGVIEGPYVVPQGHVFVLGDNRDNSSDSRYYLGGSGMGRAAYVPYGHIKGKAMVVWLALGYGGVFSRFFDGTGLRTDRLFLPVR